MRTFKAIYDVAAKRKGGKTALDALLPKVKTPRGLARLNDATILNAMARDVFRSGFSWRVVDMKWSEHERAFHDFHVGRVALMDEAEMETLANDARVIRHRKKLASVRENARWMTDVAREHGSFARLLADWPADDVVGLWLKLKKEGSRLGGNTGPRFLRNVGFDTFLLTGDVVTALMGSGIVDQMPTSQRDMRKAQAAFIAWKEQSGRSFAEISRVLACTVP